MEVTAYEVEPRANLAGAHLRGVHLTGAIADRKTTWPEGFDPVAAGVILE